MKKGKLLIPFAVMSLACGLSAGILTGCNGNEGDGPHTHEYSWVYEDESGHWQECKLGDSTTEKEPHELDENGNCECGYSALLEIVSGTVSVEGGALNGVSIKLKNAAGDDIAVTDYTYNAETGAFSFKVPVQETGATEYTLVVSKEGCIDATGVIEVSKGEPVTNYKINLTLLVQIAVDGAEWNLVNAGANGSITKVGGGYGRTMSVRNYSGNILRIEQKIQLPQSVIDAGIVEGDQYGSRQGFTVLFEDGESRADWYSGDFTLMTRDDNGTPYTQIDVTNWKTNGCGKEAFGWGSINNAKRLSAAQEAKYVSEGITLSAVYTDGAFDFFIDGEYFGSYEVKQELKSLDKLRFGVCSWLNGTANYVFNVSELETLPLNGELPETFEHGTLSYDKTAYGYGDSMTITVTPEQDHELKSLKINGVDYLRDMIVDAAGVGTVTIQLSKALSLEVAAEFQEIVSLNTAEITLNYGTDDKFSAEGCELEFSRFGITKKETVANKKVTLTDLKAGEWSVSANLGGIKFYLGSVDIVKSADANVGTGTLTLTETTLNGSSNVQVQNGLLGYDLKTGTVILNTSRHQYHNYFPAAVGEGYFALKLSFDQETKDKYKADGGNEMSFSFVMKAGNEEMVMPIQIKKTNETLFQVGMNHSNNGDYNLWNGKAIKLNEYMDDVLGDGVWVVVRYDAETGALPLYVGTQLNNVRLAGNLPAFRAGVSITEIGLGNWTNWGEVEGRRVNMQMKYGKTMADIGMTLENKVEVTASVNNGEMGSIACNASEYYVGEEGTVTVTATKGYFLKSIQIGSAAAVTTGWTQNGLVYTYQFTVPAGGATIVATLEKSSTVNVTLSVTGEGIAEGTAVTLTAVSDGAQTDWTVGGNSLELIPGEYKVYAYGYAVKTVTIPQEDGTVTVELVKTMAYASANDTKGEITINDTDKTISFKGNGQSDRDGNRKIDAELVLTQEQKDAQELTLTFTIKRTQKSTNGGDAWAASRFGVQIGAGEVGFYVFMREAQGNAADVAKLINGTLSLNPDQEGRGEQKWHGNDPDIKWVSDAAYGEGLQMKVVRTGGKIHIYGLNGESWVRLDTDAMNGENVTAGGDLNIGNDVKNEIRLLAGGDDWAFSGITVATEAENLSPVTLCRSNVTVESETDLTGTDVTLTDKDDETKTYTVQLKKNGAQYYIEGYFAEGNYNITVEGYTCTSAGNDEQNQPTTALWIDNAGGQCYGITLTATQTGGGDADLNA